MKKHTVIILLLVCVDIYFTVVGMMSIPDENEIRAMIEEIKNMPKSIKLVS